MSTENTPPENIKNLAQWLDQPLTPGKERDLNEWLSRDPENQVRWERWLKFNVVAKELRVTPSDVLDEWSILRDKLELGRSSRTKRRSSSGAKKSSFWRRPLVIAILSMAAYSLFLLLLQAIRTSSAF